MKWRDKQNVVMISTYHDAEMKSVTKRGKEAQKPVCVIDYNKWMGWSLPEGSAAANIPRRKKAYAQMVPEAVQKTSECHDNLSAHTGKQIDQLAFRVNLVEALFRQLADAERKVPGCRAGDNTIPRLWE
jgi:hypothetical protein